MKFKHTIDGVIIMSHYFDKKLFDWNDIKNGYEGYGIFLGNGFSQNIWKNFGYTSLFHLASNGEFKTKSPLEMSDINLFRQLKTENFETVLSALVTCKLVLKALKQCTKLLDDRERSIRNSLICAVLDMHVTKRSIPDRVLEQISSELLKYSSIFTTNFDLLIYWSIMHNTELFCDYLWSGKFDRSNSDIWQGKKPIHYLHGGLHLCRYPDGSTGKRKWRSGTILSQFELTSGEMNPLFVADGTSHLKVSSINESDYLRFLLEKFQNYEGPLVIFGHSLSEGDKHIVDIICSKNRSIAISVHGSEDIRKRKSEVVSQFLQTKNNRVDESGIQFFKSETHPLGISDLQVRIS